MTVRYAVLMKIHFWDDFAQRRLQHLISKVSSGDVYVFVDETKGAVNGITHERTIRATEDSMAKLGVLLHPPGKIFWYNVDYPLYYFYLQNNFYDYYLMCEYDVVLNIDIDDFVSRAEKHRVDYVGFRLTEPTWPLHSCEGVYPDYFELHQSLNCVSLYSRRSVEFLLDRRRLLTRSYRAGEIMNWPNNEAFIPTEMKNNGFVVRELGDFGKTERYNWWPPSHEKDLPLLREQTFLHPVLDERRYAASCMQQSDLRTYFLPSSRLRRLLSRCSPFSSIPVFAAELARRMTPSLILELVRHGRRIAVGRQQR
jgi:hypothetical protein